MIRRFDLSVDGRPLHTAEKVYCEDGDFVDADVAQELYEALVQATEDYVETGEVNESTWGMVDMSLAKARGEK